MFGVVFVVLCSSSFALFPCDLMTIFIVMFGFLSLFFVYIYYRFLGFGYPEVYIWVSVHIHDYFKLLIS